MEMVLNNAPEAVVVSQEALLCYHCGTPCISNSICLDEKCFCCEGCQLVYELLNENGLCDYYKLQNHPGLSRVKAIRNDKYAYLDDAAIAKQLYKFSDGKHVIVTFYIPGVHCSSCMWLLEHLQRLNPGISESRLNFTSKEVTIHFLSEQISIRNVVELLATVGYEPYISLDDAGKKKTKSFNRQRIYKLGVAGFCFGNIMMMSLPEYFGHSNGIESQYASLFRYLNLVLSLPVFFYSASEFFVTAWKGLQQKMLNIDAPICLAVIIAFARSIYEIGTHTGSGFLDSMSGIVFFMLVGRVVQERAYKSISFHRDYKSYFPIAVSVLTADGVVSKNLHDLKEKDIVQLYSDEIVPADAILIKGNAQIDYSFVTGETEPVNIKVGEMLYAGGKQRGEQLTLQIVKPVAGSYLTSLWNHYAFNKNKIQDNDEHSVIHAMSRYFTWILLSLALVTALFWGFKNPANIIPSVTAMLIVACPCALLLAATYTNGNLLRIFSTNGLFLRDATVIEQLGKIDQIVFDKTGTLTHGSNQYQWSGHSLSEYEKHVIYTVAANSKHPYSKHLVNCLGQRDGVKVDSWKEHVGKGIEAVVGDLHISIGSAAFTGAVTHKFTDDKANVYVRINENISAFHVQSAMRSEIPKIIGDLDKHYKLSLLSGDHDSQKAELSQIFNNNSELLFEQKPIDKLQYIEQLQQQGGKVAMIGDGLNDAGALQQSNVGITLADDINNFTPSCDVILDASKLSKLPALMRLARVSGKIINTSFVISILYNIIGLSFAMQGLMNPMMAAILMPCSTLSIVLISSGLSSVLAKRYGLAIVTLDK